MRHVGVRCSILAAAFLAVVPLGAAPSAIPAPDDLGSLGGSPFDVNPGGFGRDGTVVGSSRVPGMPAGQQAPFSWSASGGFRLIANVNGVAIGANDVGQAVGYLSPLNSPIQGFLWTPPSGLVTIASPLAVAVYPHVVNHSGQVAGEFDSVDGSRHAFLWSASGGFKDLGNLGGSTLTVTAITGNGQIVGYAQITTGETHAFLWKSGPSIKDLGTLAGGSSYAYAANDAGLIAGISQNGAASSGFIYQKGKMTALASPSGVSAALAMNSNGTAVGTDNNGNALVWPLGSAPTVVTGGGIAYDINDAGQVALAMPTSPFYSYPTRAGFWSASTGVLDAGSDDEPHSAGFGVTADGRLICKRDDWAGAHKAYVWQSGVPRKMLDGFPGAGFTRALFINDAGQVAGVSRTILGYDRAFLWTPGSGMIEVPAPTGLNSTPIAMNSSGQVIGSTMRGGTQPVSGPAFFWNGSATYDLGQTVLVGVNDSGTVLGEVTGPGGAGFIWSNGVTTTVAPSGPFYQVLPADINNLGQVVGTYGPDAFSLKAFSWKAGVFTDLGTLGGSRSYGVAVNDSGLIAGNSMLTGDLVTHAFKMTLGKKMTDLGSLYGAGGTSTAIAMNKNGVIVGSSSDSTHFHLFLYDGKMHDLGDPGNFDTVPGLNDLKDVVGWRLDPATGTHAFVCLGGGIMTDLPDTQNQDGSQAFAINNAGSAVGNAVLKDDQRRALLWHCR